MQRCWVIGGSERCRYLRECYMSLGGIIIMWGNPGVWPSNGQSHYSLASLTASFFGSIIETRGPININHMETPSVLLLLLPDGLRPRDQGGLRIPIILHVGISSCRPSCALLTLSSPFSHYSFFHSTSHSFTCKPLFASCL